MKIIRRIFLLTLLVIFLAASLLGEALETQHAASPPNIIFILADDLGFGDLGWEPFLDLGMEAMKTPNLKQMAKEGKLFSNFHVASSASSPSRAALMTGLFPWRLGFSKSNLGALPLLPNLAISLKEMGYYTAHVGKWGLGGCQLSLSLSHSLFSSPCCSFHLLSPH